MKHRMYRVREHRGEPMDYDVLSSEITAVAAKNSCVRAGDYRNTWWVDVLEELELDGTLDIGEVDTICLEATTPDKDTFYNQQYIEDDQC
ncbi:hypothetical protein LCGC14_0415690 [marine sediment metagenome]|uniref:Uncharacterized protein n=1 Tax=marine sediment metagenome TaxID=412755 RepID=A0A0F9W1J5_9ZZZZ